MNEKIEKKPVFLSPFKRFCMTIGELPTSYLETMTYYEMLLWFTKYLGDTVIPTINNNAEAVDEMQKLFVELQDYVNTYFENLDIQTEVNNKLDEMAESGQLADIIAQYLELNGVLAFDTKNDLKNADNITDGSTCKTLGNVTYNDGKGHYYKIRPITSLDVVDDENILSLTNNTSLIAEKIENYYLNELLNESNETILGVTFKQFSDSNQDIKNYLIKSTDGINYSYVELNTILGRDPSLIYFNDRFYIATTPSNTTYTFNLYETTDFVNFTKHEINLTNYNNHYCWAPDLYVENNKMYVTFSNQVGTTTDYAGNSIPEMNIVITETTDFENFNFTNTHPILTSGNFIDSNIIKISDKYYLAVKNEYYKTIQLYRGDSVDSYSLYNENIIDPSSVSTNSIRLEGVQQFIFNNTYYVMCDSFNQMHTQIIGKSDNFSNFTFAVSNLGQFKHVGLYVTENPDILRQINQVNNWISTSTQPDNTPTNYTSWLSNSYNGNIVVTPHQRFFINSSSTTVTNILNPFNVKEVEFVFTALATATLTIQQINGVTVNKVIKNSTNNNEKIIKVDLTTVGNTYPSNGYCELTELQSADYTIDSTLFTDATVTGFKSGNVVNLIIRGKFATSGWVSNFVRINNNKFKPRGMIQMTNSNNFNIQLYDGGNISAQATAGNSFVYINATYISQ